MTFWKIFSLICAFASVILAVISISITMAKRVK